MYLMVPWTYALSDSLAGLKLDLLQWSVHVIKKGQNMLVRKRRSEQKNEKQPGKHQGQKRRRCSITQQIYPCYHVDPTLQQRKRVRSKE